MGMSLRLNDKMNKKYLTILAVIFLFLVQVNAKSRSKWPGQLARRLGATSTYLGKKYTCVKSGKKLVWNKGVAIAKPVPTVTPRPTPSPTPTVTSTPTPTPTPTPTSSPFVEGGSCEKMGSKPMIQVDYWNVEKLLETI
jgi:hypothetical protein